MAIFNQNLNELLASVSNQELPISLQVLTLYLKPSDITNEILSHSSRSNSGRTLVPETPPEVELIDNNSGLGRAMGTLFSSGLSSAGDTIVNNVVKGLYFADGLGKNTASSVTGAASGLLANYIGQGINKLGGNSMLSRGIGQGVATGLGTVGGTVLGNLVTKGSVLGKYSSLFGSTANVVDDAGKITKYGAAINPWGLGMTVVGNAFGAAFGPSKEYSGKYGGITKTMDTIYDGVLAGVNFVPGAGQVISGVMALNKGLSNVFGSTSGMTKNDAVLGSAFMPAPIKWMNVLSGHTTSNFDNQNTWTVDNVNRFMQNGFGNLGDKFNQAREETNKTYGGGIFGLFSSTDEYKKAQKNIDFANQAFREVMAMNNLNNYQNIRSLDMTSINNQRYAQNIMGGYSPIYVGKQGMKILNNATNHNIGMRLLSGAALIDDKQMILCNAHD